jgi:uncharacterized membrane protein YccC
VDSQQPGPPVRAAVASGPPAADVASPRWLTELLVPRKAPIDWRRAARAAVAIAAPIAAGTISGYLLPGVLAAIGALCGTVTSISGPYRDRARRTGMAVSAGAVGFLLGGLFGEHGWWTAALIVVAAAVTSVLSAAGNNASLAGLQLLVYLIVGTHESTVANPFVALGWFAVGAAWAYLLSIAGWPWRATAPERGMVAAVFDGMANLLTVVGTAEAIAARQAFTAAVNTAYDVLLVSRSRLAGRDQVYRRLFLTLSDATPAVEAAIALTSARHRPPRSVVDGVRQLADAVRVDDRPGELALPDQGSPTVLALVDGLRSAAAVLNDRDMSGRPDRPDQRRPPLRERVAELLDNLLGGPAAWLHALRMALCMAIAELLTIFLPLERSYWLALTVAIVLKPDFGSVFARAVQRGVGTLVGAVVGAGLIALHPNGWVLVLCAAAIAFLLPITQVRQYGMFSTTLTPLVIILLEAGHAGGVDLLVARVVDTAVACAIVLVFGYLLWPGSRKPRIGGRLADAVDVVARYADVALRREPHGRNTLRRHAYRQLSDLRTELQRVLVEPSAAGRLAAAWYPAIVGLERVTGAVTKVAVDIRQGGQVPPAEDVDQVVAALRDIRDAVRGGRPPADPPMLTSDQLANVVAYLGTVVAGLRGPDLDRQQPFPLVRRLLPRPRG